MFVFFSVAVGDDGWHVVGLAVTGVGQAVQRRADDGRHQRTTVMDDRHAGTGQPVVADTVRAARGQGGPETVSAAHRAPLHRQLAHGAVEQHDRRAVLGAAPTGRVHRHHNHRGAHLHRRDSRRQHTRRAQHVLQRHAERRHTVRVLRRAASVVRRAHVLLAAGAVRVPGHVPVDTRIAVLLRAPGRRQEGARVGGVAARRPVGRIGRRGPRADAHQGRGPGRPPAQGFDARPVRVPVQPQGVPDRADRRRGRRAVRHDHRAGVRQFHVRARRHRQDAVPGPVHHAAGRADILHHVRHRLPGGQARPPAAAAVLVLRVRRVRAGHRSVLLQAVGGLRVAGRLDTVHRHRVVRRHLQHRARAAVAHAPGRDVPVQRPRPGQRHHVRHAHRHIVCRPQDVPGHHRPVGHTRQLFHIRHRVPGVVPVDLPVPARDQGQDVRADPERDHEDHRRRRPAVPQQEPP